MLIIRLIIAVWCSEADVPFIYWAIPMTVLLTVGLWRMFVKSNIRPVWALIPCARDYKLSVSANREPDGRTLSVSLAVYTLTSVFRLFSDSLSERAWLIVGVTAVDLTEELIKEIEKGNKKE